MGTITNNGTITNDGTLYNISSIITNNGTITNNTNSSIDNYNGTIIEWVGLGEKALARKGYELVWVERPATAELRGESQMSVCAVAELADGEPKYDPEAPIVG